MIPFYGSNWALRQLFLFRVKFDSKFLKFVKFLTTEAMEESLFWSLIDILDYSKGLLPSMVISIYYKLVYLFSSFNTYVSD